MSFEWPFIRISHFSQNELFENKLIRIHIHVGISYISSSLLLPCSLQSYNFCYRGVADPAILHDWKHYRLEFLTYYNIQASGNLQTPPPWIDLCLGDDDTTFTVRIIYTLKPLTIRHLSPVIG